MPGPTSSSETLAISSRLNNQATKPIALGCSTTVKAAGVSTLRTIDVMACVAKAIGCNRLIMPSQLGAAAENPRGAQKSWRRLGQTDRPSAHNRRHLTGQAVAKIWR